MAGKVRLFFDVAPEDKAWFAELAQSSGLTMVGLLWALADAYAAQIGFKPRPK
jgi:hypothetical protein